MNTPAPSDIFVADASEFVRLYGESDRYECRLYDSRDAWLAGRKGRDGEVLIGASAAPTVMGLTDSWCTRRELFEQMCGRGKDRDLSGNELVQMGVREEPLIRELVALENREYQFFDGTNLQFVSRVPGEEFMSATLDCIGVHRETGELVDVEIKSAPWSHKWKGQFAPDNYFAQLMHQSRTTGIAHVVLRPRIRMEFGDGFTTATERAYEFWTDAPDIAPQVDALVEAERKFVEGVRAGKYVPQLTINL